MDNLMKLTKWLAIASPLAITGGAFAVDLSIPTIPLSNATNSNPNVMLVIDSSGSMRNIVPDAPFVESPAAPATPSYYSTSGTTKVSNPETACPSSRRAENRIIAVAVPTTGTSAPRFLYDEFDEATARTFGSGSGNLCFNPTAIYEAKLNPLVTRTINSAAYYVPEASGGLTYFETSYTGNYLNWYFNTTSVGGVTWNNNARLKPVSTTKTVSTRIAIAQQSASDLVDSMDSRLRVGLAVYDGNNGGKFAANSGSSSSTTNTVIGSLSDSGKRDGLKTAISAISAAGNTPLAQTLSDIGRYFTAGNSSGASLALHPNRTDRNSCGTGGRSVGTASCNVAPSDVFSRRLGGATSDPGAPIVESCQKSFITFLTDGRNTQDISIADAIKDYDGDCTPASPNYVGAGVCSGIGANNYERKTTRLYDEAITSNGRLTSDYMDDVAKALFDIDLRPTGFTGASTAELQFKNNVRTDIIGFADPTVLNDPLLRNTASQGGGTFRAAADSASLALAFQNIINDILASIGSAANAATSSSRLDGGSRVYQASYNSGNWSGSLKSFRISAGSGLTCGSVALGNLCPTEEWDAATRLNLKAAGDRVIYTYNSDTRVGAEFAWANLSTPQKDLLRRNPGDPTSVQTEAIGMSRLDYLRGVQTNEGSNVGQFRIRSGKLGDIVNSDPALVGIPRFNYSFAGYGDFRTANRTRTPVIYVGANDGMLHGFNANTGDEVLAYVPSKAYGTTTSPILSRLTQTPYTHQFVVDGSPQHGDVQLGTGNTWASVLVGTMRSGGKGVFALNVTNPSNFTTSNVSYNATTAPNGVVMWEFTDADDPSLGLTYSQPSIVKMPNGKWAAIFGNGYNSTATGADANKAALFIVYMDGPTGTGGTWVRNTDYFKLVVNSGATAAVSGVIAAAVPNGLASPTPIDINGDRIVDFIYAGDLNGNLWRFDVDSATPANWAVAYSNAPVYTARDAASGGNRQPITGRVEVGSNLNSADMDDVTIYFGTGKYLESLDNTQGGQPNQTFYGIHDVIYSDDAATTKSTTPQASNRGDLLKQDILRQVGTGSGVTAQTFRVTSNNTYTTAAEKGWYMDLFNKDNVPTAAGGPGINLGERSVSAPVLSAGRVLFSTQIPAASACSGGGTGFLMTLDAKTGQRLVTPPFDTNNDGTVNASDTVSTTLGNDATATNYGTSGVQSRVGIIDKPVIFSISPTEDILYLTGTGKPGETPTQGCGGTLECTKTPAADRRGRITWRELIK